MEAGSGQVDDLATLATLDEKTLLEEIKIRYSRDILYTYIGDILIAVNPYKPVPIYGPDVARVYTDVKLWAQHPPHIFAVSDQCYQAMRRNATSQCCVVSGESGAGKTESTKLIVQHISHLCSHHSSSLHDRIIQVNPLLEAFGNAQTMMNNNSSRFGKYIELQFDEEGIMQGARISEYLLEKSRVVSQGPGEKNFHIFYYMFAGLDQDQLRNNLLDRPEDHRIMRKPDGTPIFKSNVDYKFHRDMWDSLTRTMAVVGFQQEEMNGILAILASILMLTDITFLEDYDVEGVYIRDEAMLEMACELLGVIPEEMAAALISNVQVLRGERIVTLKNIAQANDGRDALAKALYGRLFGWLVRQVNILLQPDSRRYQKGPKIGILDIAGFENFQQNSFEQLCINAANEQLQYYFNQHIFQWELDEYKREGVKGKDIKFNDNRPVVDMFLESPLGLFSLLDEESRFPRGTDLTFVEKIAKNFAKKPQFSKPKGHTGVFTVNHYAGPVHYTVSGFLEKNRDTLSWNLLDCMKNSESQFVVELFFSPISETGSLLRNDSVPKRNRKSLLLCRLLISPKTKKPKKKVDSVPKRSRKSLLLCKAPDLSKTKTRSLSKMAGKKLRKEQRNKSDHEKVYENAMRTLGNSFRNSLTDLMAKLLEAEPHFIRCLKPNTEKRSDMFQEEVVKDQLRYTGVLETVKIRRQGYATRLPHEVFIKRYQFIAFPMTATIPPTASNCQKLCKKVGLKEWEVGKTKVFLKYWHPETLQMSLDKVVVKVIHCQRFVRGFLARKRVAKYWGNTHRQFQDLRGFCVLVNQFSEAQFFHQTRLVDDDAQRFNKLAKEREKNIKQAQAALRPPSERESRPTSKKEGKEEKKEKKKFKKGLYQPTPIILGNPVFGNPDPVTLDPNRASQRAKSPDPSHRVLSPQNSYELQQQVSNGQQQTNMQQAGGFGWVESAGAKRDSGGAGGAYNQRNSGGGAYNGGGGVYSNGGGVYGQQTPPPAAYHRRSGGGGANGYPQPQPEYVSTKTLTRPYDHTLSDTSHFARTMGNPLNINAKPVQAFMMGLLDESLEKFPDLDQEVWCKVVYTEKNQVIGKLYVREKEVIIDDSSQNFEGKVIGLKSFPSPKRDSNTTKLIKKIGKGVKLSRDGSGNIYATRLSDNDIICKGYKNPESACYAGEIIEHMGRLPRNKTLQIFCMNEYKSHIALELQKPVIDQRRLQALSMISFAFVRNTFDDLETPCWVTIINFAALDVLGNDRLLQEIKSLAHLNLSDVDDAQLRRNWAKLHHRRKLSDKRNDDEDTQTHSNDTEADEPYSEDTEADEPYSEEPPPVMRAAPSDAPSHRRSRTPDYSDTIEKYSHTFGANNQQKDTLKELVPTNKKNWAKLKVVGRDSVK